MRKKGIAFGVFLILIFGCVSMGFAKEVVKANDKAMWMYHPEKDKHHGAYEWWYMDAHLENGYLLAIMFGAPNQFLGPFNKYLDDASKGLLVPKYDPKNFAAVEFSVTDSKGNVVFDGYEDVKPENMFMPTEDNMVVRFNNCTIERIENKNDFPTYIFKMNILDREGKKFAKVALDLKSLVPSVYGGREFLLDSVVEGQRYIHAWLPLTSTADVKANIEISDVKTGKVLEVVEKKGVGYHDKNYGNTAARSTMKGWIWTKVAEPDLTMVFAEVPFVFGEKLAPNATPCIIIYKGNVLAATQEFDITKGPVGDFRLPYPTEVKLNFRPESGIKGTMKYYDLELVNCYEGSAYSRWLGKYVLDIESPKHGKIKKQGKCMFEYTDFAVDSKYY